MVANVHDIALPHGRMQRSSSAYFLDEFTDEQPVNVAKRVLMKHSIGPHIPSVTP